MFEMANSLAVGNVDIIYYDGNANHVLTHLFYLFV